MAKILKNRTVISVGEDKDQREFPRTTSGMYKLVQLLWKNSSVHMQKKKESKHTRTRRYTQNIHRSQNSSNMKIKSPSAVDKLILVWSNTFIGQQKLILQFHAMIDNY